MVSPFSRIHVMVDIETMATGTDAALASLGAVAFTPLQPGTPGVIFERSIDLDSCVKAGLALDADTILWWMKQSDSAREAVCRMPRVALGTALTSFAAWYRNLPANFPSGMHVAGQGICVWGCGAAFDNAILRTAFAKAGGTLPWTRKEDRCYRTLRELYPEVPLPERAAEHEALADAVFQAEHLGRILRHIETRNFRHEETRNWTELHPQRPVPFGSMVTLDKTVDVSMRCVKDNNGWRWQIVAGNFRCIDGAGIDGFHATLEDAQKACEFAWLMSTAFVHSPANAPSAATAASPATAGVP